MNDHKFLLPEHHAENLNSSLFSGKESFQIPKFSSNPFSSVYFSMFLCPNENVQPLKSIKDRIKVICSQEASQSGVQCHQEIKGHQEGFPLWSSG